MRDEQGENVEIVEKTEIDGLHWERNSFFRTGEKNRILLTSENSLFSTIVWHGDSPSESEYPHFALHFAGDDRLTFVNGKGIEGEFVDCRKDSPTLHKHIKMKWDADPDRRLVVRAGIAHWFKNLSSVVTRNEPVLRWDPEPDPLFSQGVDIFNINPTEEANRFPVISPHRYVLPLEFHASFAKQQRKWAKQVKFFPTRVQIGDAIYLLAAKIDGGPTAADLRRLPKAPT
ncbi:dTDP-4-dehydrorhamnose 3,5-epimerase family protein [Sinorhizobium meliloti]|uniref:dTDP-4-dehydrorhamnose 3,5-epimerase family protein n=1 Tax=Rhizobium meliloti TaxID=382 RepID=UPI000FDC998F|nr:dTDP-4-dehydrorhamnose 3,5-epimerase family protein [Sinorhizobium meliloti]RVL04756.1 hypothetical protein CN152_04315 [Sinorhizobium meliloti]RVN50613.1 hypothetical protein CN113_04770 [Sinorhizobium meliloti]